MRFSGISASALLPLTLVALLGCGHDYGPTGRITGRLTMDGKPLSPGTAVSFMQMEKGFLAFGLTDGDGKFEVKSFNDGEMPVGKYNVMVAPPAGTPQTKPEYIDPDEAFEHPELLDPVVKSEFPDRYRDTTTSGIEFEIKSGVNSFDIDLKSK